MLREHSFRKGCIRREFEDVRILLGELTGIAIESVA